MFAQDSRDKPENDGCKGRLLNSCCKSFKYPSPADKSATSPAGGERRNNILHKGLDVVRQYAALLERGVQCSTRVRKVLVETRQANPLGRSMIEMLGVLAIIAVLSVGGIAGYSKAMRMWKANEQKQMIVSLLHSMIELRGKLDKNKEFIYITPTIEAMGSGPDGATFNGSWFIDKNGNKMAVGHGIENGLLIYVLHFYSYTNKSTISDLSMQDYCISLLEAAKELGNEYLYTSYGIFEEDKPNSQMKLLFNYATLQKATLSDIYQKCKITFGEKQTGFSHFTTHIKP